MISIKKNVNQYENVNHIILQVHKQGYKNTGPLKKFKQQKNKTADNQEKARVEKLTLT